MVDTSYLAEWIGEVTDEGREKTESNKTWRKKRKDFIQKKTLSKILH
jgi:hypothetical protein